MANDTVSSLNSRIREVADTNFVLLHAVDDCEKAVKILQVQFQSFNPSAALVAAKLPQPKGRILSVPVVPSTPTTASV